MYVYSTLLFLIQVMDADRAPHSPDIIGLAIINATNGMVESPAGFWQYRNGSYPEWTNITVQS